MKVSNWIKELNSKRKEDFMKGLVIYFSYTDENYMEDVHRFCKNATIKDGLAIRGSSARSSLEKIEKWCNHD